MGTAPDLATPPLANVATAKSAGAAVAAAGRNEEKERDGSVKGGGRWRGSAAGGRESPGSATYQGRGCQREREREGRRPGMRVWSGELGLGSGAFIWFVGVVGCGCGLS